MSAVPSGWRATTLGSLGRYLNGRAFKKTEWREHGRPIIRIQNLTGTSKVFNHFDGQIEDRYVVRAGDLLVSWAATLGAFFWDGPEAVVNQHIFKVESNIEPRFHKCLLDHKLDELMRRAHGSGMVHVTRGAFDALPVVVPEDRNEQRRIVEVLEDHLSRLDAAEEYLAAATRRSIRWHRSASERLIWGSDAPRRPIRELLREPMRNGRSDRAAPNAGVGTRTLTLSAITQRSFSDENTKVTTTTAKRAEGLWLEPGDVFVQRSNTPALVGSSARYDGPRGWAIFPDLLIRLRSDASVMDSRFLAAALRSEPGHSQMRARAKGAAGSMPKIDQDAIGSALVPVPSLDAQRRVVAQVADYNHALDRYRAASRASLARSAALRRSLLAAAFSGQLTAAADHGAPIDLQMAAHA